MNATVRLAVAAALVVIALFVAPGPDGALAPFAEAVGLQARVAIAVGCNGPDAFGYVCGSSGRSYVSGTTDIGSQCDDCMVEVALPFPFTLYGQTYTSVNVSSNGNVQFASNNDDFDNIIPEPGFNQAILAFYTDLVTDNDPPATTKGIFTRTTGSAPNRTFVIEWRVVQCCGTDEEDANLFFEIQLDEGTNVIHLVYGPSTNVGITGSAGIQQGDGQGGNTFLAFRSQASIPSNGTTICFVLPSSGSNACRSEAPTGSNVPNLNDPNNDEEKDKPKETEEERQQRERTNRSNRDDYAIEGNVLAVERAPDGKHLLVTIGITRNEKVVVQVACPRERCPDIRVGDYLEADGYQNGVGDPNDYFVAEEVTVQRGGKRVKD